jgi:hypothetical protein
VGLDFQGIGPSGWILEIPRDHVLEVIDDGNLIRVSIVALMTKENAYVLQPWATNERLDPQHGEVNAKFSYNNPLCGRYNFQPYGGVSTSNGILVTTRRMFNSTFGTKTPTHLLGATTIVCQTPFCFATTLVLFNFQPSI